MSILGNIFSALVLRRPANQPLTVFLEHGLHIGGRKYIGALTHETLDLPGQGKAELTVTRDRGNLDVDLLYTPKDGAERQSRVVAEAQGDDHPRVKITSLMLDNKPQKLTNLVDVEMVLSAIGKQIDAVNKGTIPSVYISRPEFTDMGRIQKRVSALFSGKRPSLA